MKEGRSDYSTPSCEIAQRLRNGGEEKKEPKRGETKKKAELKTINQSKFVVYI